MNTNNISFSMSLPNEPATLDSISIEELDFIMGEGLMQVNRVYRIPIKIS